MTVTPHPAMAVDMHIGETDALLTVLRALAEEVDDAQWIALRPEIVSVLYLAVDKIRATEAPLNKLVSRRAAS